MASICYAVSGASGVGKTTLSQLLLDSDRSLTRTVSYTTRAPRSSEESGIAYHFVSREEFEQMLAAGKFLETATVYGDYYGTSIDTVAKILETSDCLLVLDTKGCRSMKAALPKTCVIFVVPPAMEELEARLRRRKTDSEESIKKRLANAAEEIREGLAIADFVVVNDDLSGTLFDLISIVKAVRIQAVDRAELGRKLGLEAR